MKPKVARKKLRRMLKTFQEDVDRIDSYLHEFPFVQECSNELNPLDVGLLKMELLFTQKYMETHFKSPVLLNPSPSLILTSGYLAFCIHHREEEVEAFDDTYVEYVYQLAEGLLETYLGFLEPLGFQFYWKDYFDRSYKTAIFGQVFADSPWVEASEMEQEICSTVEACDNCMAIITIHKEGGSFLSYLGSCGLGESKLYQALSYALNSIATMTKLYRFQDECISPYGYMGYTYLGDMDYDGNGVEPWMLSFYNCILGCYIPQLLQLAKILYPNWEGAL